MAKPRTCPHCGKSVDILSGYSFDEELNMVCESCGKVIFATDPAHQAVVRDNTYDEDVD